jgi:heme-degrading monooxygenase HmoA
MVALGAGSALRHREVTMHTRLLTFTGATNIDAGVDYLRDEALPILNAQKGYRGVFASVDRDNAAFSILSLWDTEADRAASDSALGKAREEALKIVGGTLTVENLEEVANVVTKPPVVGCALLVSRVSMDPASVDQNIEFFKNDVIPQIKAAPGFCALRNMADRKAGRAVVGVIFEDRASLDAYTANAEERRAPGIARGISFDENSVREILFAEIK